MLNASEVALIREGFAAVDERAVMAFYDNLFEAVPAARSMFPSNLDGQAKKLWSALDLVIRNLEQPASLQEPLKKLGQRHAAIGVTPAQYVVVADVLIQTLAEAFGDKWSVDQAKAWQAALTLVADTMMAGVEGADGQKTA